MGKTTMGVAVQETVGESLLDQVMAYQRPMLVRRLQKHLELTAEAAEELFRDTKRFLYECHLSEEPLSPTARVDEGWHTFLLFTREYAEFCETFFGRFIHHVPEEGKESSCKKCGRCRRCNSCRSRCSTKCSGKCSGPR